MNPAFSVILFTTLAGAAQGLVVVLALAQLVNLPVSPSFRAFALLLAAILLLIGLAASFAHLGRPARAWRSVLMWRTSWLSREVIVLPAFLVSVLAWWWLQRDASAALTTYTMALPAIVCIVLAALLWVCTAMIYACLLINEEWAHPSTLVYYVLTGLSSGLVLTCAVAAVYRESALLAIAGPLALAVTVLAWAQRALTVRRNATIRHRSTLQSATGIRSERLVQKSMGMSAGSFNTREFFHRLGAAALRRVKLMLFVLAYAAPTAMLAWGVASHQVSAWWLALLLQAPGLLADRWFFFAQARHPQNLYYQVVS